MSGLFRVWVSEYNISVKIFKNIIFYAFFGGVLIILGIMVYNPYEKELGKKDDLRTDGVRKLAAGVIAYQKKFQYFPSSDSCDMNSWISSCIVKNEITTYIPPEVPYEPVLECNQENGYCYIESDNGPLIVAPFESLKYTSDCFDPDEAYFVYALVEDRSGVVCAPHLSSLRKEVIFVP